MTTFATAPSTSANHGSAQPGTVGASLHASPAVKAAIAAAVAEVKAKSALITDAKPGNPALANQYKELMDRAAAARGRPLLYPFIGSGVGNGPLVELADGSVKWDMICGIGVHFFGHSDTDLIGAQLAGGIDDTLKHGNLVSNFEAYQFAETLLKEAAKGSKLKHAYISTGGAMANENALKVCFHKLFQRHLEAGDAAKLLANFTPTPRVIAFKDCFMGRSMVMAQIGDNHAGREGLPNGVMVDYMPFYDEHAVERMGGGATGKKRFIDMCLWHLQQYTDRYPGGHACFIFELCQGEGGFNVGDRDYFKALMEFCKAKKIAVWDDEIQTFGRTSRMFAYEHFDLGEYVDVFCVGKMTQACATAWTEEFNPKTAILSGTFTGEGTSFRVGTRVIERLRDGTFYSENGEFNRHHALFRKHAMELINKHPNWFPAVQSMNGGGEKLVGGVGGMCRFTPFGGDKKKVMDACKACFDEGVILFYCGHGPYHVRMLPPMPVMKDEYWPKVFACIERGLAKVAG